MNKVLKQKGSVFIALLIFSLVLLVIAITGIYLSRSGYVSLASEQKYEIAEKLANSALVRTVSHVAYTRKCEVPNVIFKDVTVVAKTDVTNSSCFIWAKANFKGAEVLKTAVVPVNPPLLASVIIKYLNSINLGNNSLILSCESDVCEIPALITGNLVVNATTYAHKIANCSSSAIPTTSAICAKTDPYVPNAFDYSQADLTSSVFKVNSRSELLETLSKEFGVKLNNGLPVGLINSEGIFNFSSCSASGNTITCDGNTFVWDNTTKAYKYGSNYYKSIDLGNANLVIGSCSMMSCTGASFSGGGKVATQSITIYGGSTVSSADSSSPLVLVSRSNINLDGNDITLSDVVLFANAVTNLSSTTSGCCCCSCSNPPGVIVIEGGLIYGGGSGGGVALQLVDNSIIGKDTPTIIISDAELDLIQTGNARINGIIYASNPSGSFAITQGTITSG